MKKKHFKLFRFLSVLLSLLLLTALSACGKGVQSQNTGGGLVVVDSIGSGDISENENAPEESGESRAYASSETTGEEESFLSLPESPTKTPDSSADSTDIPVEETGTYTSKEEVAAYIHRFGHLPSNYITKSKAKKLGWDSSGRNLWEVAPGKSIGGGPFGNYDNTLPEGSYRECDIDFDGKRRGVKRIVYSDDGRIYYTEDHYETFERLY